MPRRVALSAMITLVVSPWEELDGGVGGSA
jgi:hypothetical protein